MTPGRRSTPARETEPRRIYLAFTPYHLLLCLAVQDRDGYPKATILFADEARLLEHAPQVGAMTRELADLRLTPTLEGHPSWQYPVRCRLVARQVQRSVGSSATSQIYIANAVRPESQRLFRRFGRRMPFRFVEDGLDSYIASNRAEVALWRRSLHRALCGSPHPSTGDMVGAFAYESYNVVAPEISRTPPGRSEMIPTASVRQIAQRLWSVIPVPAPERAITDLYLLANSERMSAPASYLRETRDWVRRRQREDPMTYVGIKAHPRERDARFLSEIGGVGDYVVPHWVPAELLADALSPRVSVHCGLTTFVLTSRLLVPGRRLLLDDSVAPEHAELLRRWDPTVTFGDLVPFVPAPVSETHSVSNG